MTGEDEERAAVPRTHTRARTYYIYVHVGVTYLRTSLLCSCTFASPSKTILAGFPELECSVLTLTKTLFP